MRGRFVAMGALVLLTAACTVGSGNLSSETRQVSGFHEIVLMTSGDVVIDVTGTDSLKVEADDNVLPLLTADVVGGRLELGSSGAFSTSRRITYTITAAQLDGITVSGSGNVDVSGVHADTFRAKISGSGNVSPAGTSSALSLVVSGSGRFDGENLRVANADVAVSGSGDAVVNATAVLNVVVSGSGDVRYVGNPVLSQSISGSGSVSPR